MSAKDQIKQIVDYFKREPQLKDKTDGMAEGLLLGANLADEANERSKESRNKAVEIHRNYIKQILAHDLDPGKDPELVDLRSEYETAGERVAAFEFSANEQLNKTANEVVSLFHKSIGYTTLEFEGAEDGEDNVAAFTAAVARFEGQPGKIVFSGNKSYYFSKTVHVPYNISIDFGLAHISPMVGGEYINGFIFFVNADEQGNVIRPWGGEYISTIHSARFVNNVGVSGIKGFYSKSKTNFEDITFKQFAKGYLKEGSTDADYSDMIKLKALYFINCEGSEPLIDITHNGDGLLIDACHVTGAPDKNHNLLNLYACNGGRIDRCINGDITITGSSAITIDSLHMEHGKIKIVNSTFSIKDVMHWWHSYYQPIPLTIINSQYTIENYIVCYVQEGVGIGSGLAKNYGVTDSIDAVIQKSTGEIKNFYRKYYSGVGTGIGMKTAVKISTDGVLPNNNWESNNQVYSKSSFMVNDSISTSIKEVNFDENFVSPGASITNHGIFEESANTYYYRAVFYFGPYNRKIGRFGGNEVVATVNSESDYPLLNFIENTKTQFSKVRIYRGTSSGNYSHYVDVPIGSGLAIYDGGFFVSTGERWRSREWVGPIDDYNMFFTKMELRGENITVYGDRLPTFGRWLLGDFIVISNGGVYQEYVCSKSGDFAATAPIFKQRM